MPERPSNHELIKLAEQVTLNRATTFERRANLLKLAVFIRQVVVWRTTIHSHESAMRVWKKMEDEAFDMEDIMNMTGEMMIRAENVQDSHYDQLAKSLSWTSEAHGIPPEMKAFSVPKDKYKEVLQNNPWVWFLYLLSMSEIHAALEAVISRHRPPSPTKGREQ